MDVQGESSGELVSTFVAVRPRQRRWASTSHLDHVPVTTPGSRIATETGFVRGHGTLLASNTPTNGQALTATVAGVIERVNKLIAVRPLRARYDAQVGDVVVGRVVDIVGKRWKLDVNARSHAFLLLSAVTLPGGVQRRRTYEDELNMRSFFSEGDLISAEVQELWNDGGIALHTRSLRYGNLEQGQFVSVQCALVKRAKKHFHALPCGVEVILGNNGYIFISEHTRRDESEERSKQTCDHPSIDMRRRIARVRNSIVALDMEFISISARSITEVYDASIEQQVELGEMSRADVCRAICERARALNTTT